MISDPLTKCKQILADNINITSLLSTFEGTTIPLIKFGVLDGIEESLPCITIYPNSYDKYYGEEDSIFTVNCYALTLAESMKLGREVVNEVDNTQSADKGYPVTVTARLLGTDPDPTAKQINTVVEMRLFKIGGC